MKITFRKFEDGEVIALFPNEKWDQKGNIASYEHIGQHGGASPELLEDLQRPSEKEYKPLLDELINNVGYSDLEVDMS